MKLSIITINLNNAEGLRRTMESVLRQTFKDFEYIVVDGASSDGSVEVMEELSAAIREAGVSVDAVSEPDSGLYNAMNKGARKAKGDYLLFLNSGDFLISEDGLKDVFSEKTNVDIINARCVVSNNGKRVWVSPYLPKITLKTLYTIGIPHQSTLIKRDMFNRFGVYREDLRYNSDIAFWYKAILYGGATTKGIDVVLTDYNDEGISSVDSESELYQNEMKEIYSEGILPRVLPDYEEWAKERQLFNKYLWIEKHRVLQFVLNLYYKICKHI